MSAFEIEMTRALLFELAVLLIALMLSIWITYLVIKNAIRDGINESRLGDRWTRAVEVARADTEGLPPMRAER